MSVGDHWVGGQLIRREGNDIIPPILLHPTAAAHWLPGAGCSSLPVAAMALRQLILTGRASNRLEGRGLMSFPSPLALDGGRSLAVWGQLLIFASDRHGVASVDAHRAGGQWIGREELMPFLSLLRPATAALWLAGSVAHFLQRP